MDLEDRILFINNDVVVVNKAAGEAMQGAGKEMKVLPLLLEDFLGKYNSSGEHFIPEAVHRLDVPVTGCALFARNAESVSFLNKSFSRNMYEGGRAEKYYWAIVELSPSFSALPDTGELVHWIRASTKNNKSTAYNEPGSKSKEAILRYRIRGKGKKYGFMELELVTGRHHQIRAQLAALGIHIKGDLKYGAKRSERGGGIRLHARSLYFPNPSRPGNFIRVCADPPVMDALWTEFQNM